VKFGVDGVDDDEGVVAVTEVVDPAEFVGVVDSTGDDVDAAAAGFVERFRGVGEEMVGN
jgi:hypothetical protein